MKKGAENKKNFEKQEGFSFFVKFKETKSYLKSSRKYVYLICWIFLLFTFIGFFVPLPKEITSQLIQYFNSLVKQTESFGSVKMIAFLFQNNVFASFLGLLGGILFGIFPLFNGIMNGFVLGFAAKLSVTNNGLFSLWRLFPHGVFELPALFISLGIGLRLGGKFMEKYFKVKGELKQVGVMGAIVLPLLILIGFLFSVLNNYLSFVFFVSLVFLSYYFLKEEELRKEFKLALNVFLFIVFPLLVIAAIIEGLLITL